MSIVTQFGMCNKLKIDYSKWKNHETTCEFVKQTTTMYPMRGSGADWLWRGDMLTSRMQCAGGGECKSREGNHDVGTGRCIMRLH